MHLSCSQEHLVRGLSAVRSAVSKRATLPVLTHILLDARASAGENRLRIAATDLDLGIACWIPAQIEAHGAIAVPARVFADWIGTLPPEPVRMVLHSQTQTLQVCAGRNHANIKGIDAGEFPEMPALAEPNLQFSLEAKGLSEMFDRVGFAAATEASRPVLTGVLVKFEERHLTLAAADGFRLSIQHTGMGDASKVEPFSLIIPVKALQEVGRLCADQVEPVRLTVAPNKTQVRFGLTAAEVVAQLIDGAYPDVSRILPQEHTSRAVVNAAELLAAAKMVSAFVDRNSSKNGMRLEADPANHRVIVMGAHAERGDGIGDVDAAIEGDAFHIALQASYLLAMLERVSAPQVAIEYLRGRQLMPVVVRPVGDEGFVHVIMPLADVAGPS